MFMRIVGAIYNHRNFKETAEPHSSQQTPDWTERSVFSVGKCTCVFPAGDVEQNESSERKKQSKESKAAMCIFINISVQKNWMCCVALRLPPSRMLITSAIRFTLILLLIIFVELAYSSFLSDCFDWNCDHTIECRALEIKTTREERRQEVVKKPTWNIFCIFKLLLLLLKRSTPTISVIGISQVGRFPFALA